MFLCVNYWSAMFRPQLLAIFRELASFSTCAAYVKLHLCCVVCYIAIVSSIYDIIMLCYIKLHLCYITLHLCYMFCYVKLQLRCCMLY